MKEVPIKVCQAKHQAEPATNHWLGRSFPLRMHVCKNIPKHLDHIWKTLAIVALLARCSLKLLGHPSDIRPYIHRWFTTKSFNHPLIRPYFLQVEWHWYPKSSDNKHPARTPLKKRLLPKGHSLLRAPKTKTKDGQHTPKMMFNTWLRCTSTIENPSSSSKWLPIMVPEFR